MLIAGIQPDRLIAQPFHQSERMRHEQHGLAASSEITEPVETLVGKRLVADRQHFVDEQDVRVHVDRDGEAETHVHAR